jgi:hypothetical protein
LAPITALPETSPWALKSPVDSVLVVAAHRVVLVLVRRNRLELILGHVEHDAFAVVADLQILPVQAGVALADAEEAADADDHAVDLAVGVEIDRFDLADRVVVRILDVAPDQLAGIGRGRRRHVLGRGAGRRLAGGGRRMRGLCAGRAGDAGDHGGEQSVS